MEQPIADETEYVAALAELAQLMDTDSDGSEIEALAKRIEAYERIHYPMEES